MFDYTMDKSEPPLVPEWLRSSGNASNLSASALLRSDARPLSKQAQYRSSLNGSDHIPVLERTTSAYLRRSSSSNGSANSRSSSSFSRKELDRDWDDMGDYFDKEKLVLGNHRHCEHSHHLGNILPSKFDKDKLQRSQSMIVTKQDNTWSKRVTGNLTNVHKYRQGNSNGNGLSSAVFGNTSVHGTAFELDYPSLGTEEKQGSIVRVSSPLLSTSIHNVNPDLVYSNSQKLFVTKAPVVTSTGARVESPKQAVPAALATPFPNSGLNMAEALAKGPSHARTPPQSTAGMQRFEELAIRQAKLIPMTPTPKALVVSPLEKSKPKFGLQQNSLHPSNHAHSPARTDSTEVSNERRLQILKPTREPNAISSAAKNSLSPSNGLIKVNSPIGNSPLANASTEKRSTFLVQSRKNFFNHLKKTSCESVSQVTTASVTENGRDCVPSDFNDADKRGISVNNANTFHVPGSVANGEKDFGSDLTPKLDEEEAAFLRSLGWDENGGEDEGLTEEEIRAFCEKYKARLPTSKIHPSI